MAKDKSGHPNTPAFSKEAQRTIFNNPEIKSAVIALVTALKEENPDQDFDLLLLDLEDRFDTSTGKGLLEEITTPRGTGAPTIEIDFGSIANETFSLAEIESIHNFLGNNPFDEKLKKTILEYLKSEIKDALPRGLQDPFEEAVRDWNNNLNDLFLTLKSFESELNNKDKKEYRNTLENFSVSIRQIKNALESAGENMDDLNTKKFQNWELEHKQSFDTLITKNIIKRLLTRVKEGQNLIEDVKNTFDKVAPPLNSIFSKYPIELDDLKIKYPDKAEELNAIEAERADSGKTEEEINELENRRNSVVWEMYLEDLSSKDPELAAHFRELIDSDFDFSLLTNPADFFKTLGNIRYDNMDKEDVIKLFGKDPLAFKSFFQSLFDLNASELKINGYSIPIKKTVVPGRHENLHTISDISIFDELPLEYELDLKNANFSIEDRAVLEKIFADNLSLSNNVLKISNREIGKLLFLFKIGEDSIFDSYDPRKAKGKLSDFFSNLDKEDEVERKKRELKNNRDNPERDGDDTPDSDRQDEHEDSPEAQKKFFYEEWNKLSGMKGNESDFGFKVGSKVYFSIEESRLPPYEISSKSWEKMEITEINEEDQTFKVKILGSEEKIKGENTKEWGPLPMNGEWIKDKLGKGNIQLLQDSQKITEEYSDFNQQFDALQKAGICNGDILGDAVFKNGKFMITPRYLDGTLGDEEEVSYFGSSDMVPASDSSKMKRYDILYQIKHNRDHTITVSSEFIDTKGDARTYKQKMSYSDFIFFLKEKKLSPKTKKQAEMEQHASQDVISSKRKKWQFTSIHSIVYGIKNIWKNLNAKLDEYQKQEDEKFLNYLISDIGIYNIIGKTLGGFPSIKDAANSLQEEFLLKKESNAWKSIEVWINKFSSMQDYANLFEKGFDHPNGYTLDAIIGKGNTLQKILLSGKNVYDDDTLRPIMAAAMIANLKNGKGLYRGITGKDNQGLWVKCLLGDSHYARYRAKRAEVLEKIKKGVPNADQLQDQLRKSEVDYIVNNIRNSNGTEGAFGSIDDDNKQILKQLYSDKFAGELESAANEMTGKGAIEGAYGKIKHNNFAIASNDFKRFIKSGRVESALANLKKMGDLAKTDENHRQLRCAMTYVVISGVMNRYGDKAIRKWFDTLARTYSLPTAFFAKKWHNQKYSVHLLNQIFPKPDPKNFSLATGYKISDFDENSQDVPYGKLLDSLDIRRRDNNEKIEDFFSGLKSRDCSDDPILQDIKNVLWEKVVDNIDSDWAANSGITSYKPLSAVLSIITRNKSYDASGFRGKDVDEKNDIADFWKNVLKELKKIENNPNAAEFLLKQYVTWFSDSEGDYAEMISRLRTALAVKQHGNKPFSFSIKGKNGADDRVFTSQYTYKSGKDEKDILWFLFKGRILAKNSSIPPNEFEAVLDFFRKYFSKNLSTITEESTLNNVFGNATTKTLESKRSVLVPWEEYNEFVDKNNPYGNFYQNGDEEKDVKSWKKSKYRSDDLFLNERLVRLEKKLNNIGISGVPGLSGFDDNFTEELADSVYGRAA